MKNIEYILKSIQPTQALTKQLGLASTMSEIVMTQGNWQKNFSGLNMLSEIAKSLNHKPIFNPEHMSAIEAITKSIAFKPHLLPSSSVLEAITKSIGLQEKFSIPQSALEAINSIGQQHEQLFGNLKSFTASFNLNQFATPQMNSLRNVLSDISGKFGAIAATQRDWTLLGEFENISQQALEISNDVSTDFIITEEYSERFEKLIEYIITFIKKNKKFGTNALLFISVVVNLMNIHQYIDFVREKPAAATKEDLIRFETRIVQRVTEKLKEEKEYRITKRRLKVLLKPTSNTLVIETLPVDFEFTVLQVRHKWLYINYISPEDNLPKTGWILKKYTFKPKY